MEEPKPFKPKNPLEPDEDDSDEEEFTNKSFSQISVGDIVITSKKLIDCRRELKTILKDKQVKNYLGIYSQNKMLGFTPPSYID